MYMRSVENRTLEMLAVAMSEEYSIKVVCNGQRAFTTCSGDGRRPVITIPSVPLHDKNYRVLLRGYVDHEVGHIRFTDRAFLADALAREPERIGSLRTVASIYEDVSVERKMGEYFPGCSRNLRKLSLLLYHERRPEPVPAADILAKHAELNPGEIPYALWTAVMQYILYRVRSDVLPKLAEWVPVFREPVEVLAPGLSGALEPVLTRVQTEGTCTAANMQLAHETMDIVQRFFDGFTTMPARQPIGNARLMSDTLQWVLRNGGSSANTMDVGKAAERLVDQTLNDADEALLAANRSVYHPYGSPLWKNRLLPLSPTEQKEALQHSAMMEAQMQALLQSFMLNRSGPTRTGRLNTNALHKLYTCNDNLFYKTVDRQGINTEIVLSIDMSGSMRFSDKAIMASKALYSVAHCLSGIRGLAFSITGFSDTNVLDILRAGDRVTPRMKIVPEGGTRCGSALNFAMQTFTSALGTRRIIMMITDGDANDDEAFTEAIAGARRAGVEFLGIGILDSHILDYLPAEECCVLSDLHQLAPEILRMLRKKMGISG